jgi:hypothetical protein
MHTLDSSKAFRRVFSELVDGTNPKGGYVLNTGDAGLLRSLDRIPAADASRAVNGGATIAAHVQHVRYGLSLMNEWASKGGNPFANAKWDEAWKMPAVNDSQCQEIRDGLRDEAAQWLQVLKTPRDMSSVEFTGLVGSIAHLAYHLGAIRQINKDARGPKEGTF